MPVKSRRPGRSSAKAWISSRDYQKHSVPPAYFLPIAARLETDRVLSLIGEVSNSTLRRSGYVAVAEALASERPDQAERVFQLIDDSGRAAHENKTQVAVRLCRLMAKTDPERARRIIAGLKNTPAQACAWALLAQGLADGDKPAARLALAESIKLIDHAGTAEQATAERPVPLMFVAANPAASILPIVENVAPERLEEVFWKAVAHMPKDETASKRGIADHRLAVIAIFLARLRPPTGRRIRDAGHDKPLSQPGQQSLVGRPGLGERRSARCRGDDRSATQGRSELDACDERGPRRAGHLPGRTDRRTMEGHLELFGRPGRRT